MARRSSKKGKKRSADAPRPSAWESLSEGRQHLVCLLFLLAIALGFFAPVLFSDLSLVGGDIVRWRAMAEVVLEQRQEAGEQVLWAPNAFAGMPAYMISYPDQVPQIDTVFGWLRQVAWPASHLIVMLTGVYAVVVLLAKRKLAAVLAAVAFGLTTYMPVILTAGHNSKFIALSFAPWLVFAFAYALRRPRLIAGLLFAIALAANLRAGHVQITYYVSFMLGVWWIVELVGALRHGRAKSFGLATAWLGAGAVLGILMVAQPYLVSWEYKAFTIRGAAAGGGEGGLAWDYAMAWSQGAGELLTLLIAHAYGGASPTYWGPKTFTQGPHYVGGIVVLLALFAVSSIRRNVVWSLGIAVVLMVLFSLGDHLAVLNRLMFEYFPLFDAFRVPETWLVVVALGLAVLAGLGLAHAVRREEDRKAEREKWKTMYTSLGVVAGFLLILLLFKGSLLGFERPGEAAMLSQQIAMQNNVSPDDPRVEQAAEQYLAGMREERVELFTDDAVRTLIFVLLAGLTLWAYQREKLPAWAVQSALVLLVVVDLWGVDRRHLGEEQLVRTESPEQQIATYDFDQYLLQQREEAGGAGVFRVLSLETGDPSRNARPSYHHESLGGYHGAKLRLYQDFLERLLSGLATGAPNDNLLDILNTRYVVARQPLAGLDVVYQGEQTGMLVLRNPDALPRAFFVDEVEVVEETEALWQRLESDTFDPQHTALLSEPLDVQTTPVDSASTATVELVRYEPDEIVWDVVTDAPRLLVASEIYYPAGWEAVVDGEEVPIYRVNHLLRGVPVPEGEHRVEMRFEPATHVAGVWISAIATLLVYGGSLLLLGLSWQKRRKRISTEEAVANE